MLNVNERAEAKMEHDAFFVPTTEEEARRERENQVIMVTAAEYARAAQHKALLIALRTAAAGERYDLEKVAAHVVDAFNELEGAGC